jgi:hypothetical protein
MSDHRSQATREGQPSAERSQRLWRLRKLHQVVDAELQTLTGAEVELRYLYNGEKAYGRRWANRALAIQHAIDKRAELERDGWVFHW